MMNSITKIILGIIMILLFLGGILLILADEMPGQQINLIDIVMIKTLGFVLFYAGILMFKNIQWKN